MGYNIAILIAPQSESKKAQHEGSFPKFKRTLTLNRHMINEFSKLTEEEVLTEIAFDEE
jgi:hypothetical protein